jgi:hypothetical protein
VRGFSRPRAHRPAVAAGALNRIEHLYAVIDHRWDPRFEEIDAVVLNELNAIVATQSPIRCRAVP